MLPEGLIVTDNLSIPIKKSIFPQNIAEDVQISWHMNPSDNEYHQMTTHIYLFILFTLILQLHDIWHAVRMIVKTV